MLSAVVWARQGAEGRRPGALDEEGSSSRKDEEEHAENDDEDELPPGVGVSEREHNTDAHVLETEDDEEEDGSDGGGPGFGIVGAAIAVLSVAVLARRRD